MTITKQKLTCKYIDQTLLVNGLQCKHSSPVVQISSQSNGPCHRQPRRQTVCPANKADFLTVTPCEASCFEELMDIKQGDVQ